ncbi:MAG: NADH-quinone oxidoreductase subunit NuoE [Methylomicrobium sp.]
MQTKSGIVSKELSPAEINEINAEMSHYADKSAVSIEALKIVQKHRGWISDESLIAIAEFLGTAPAQLEGVATFYNLIYRRPVGKTVIHVCDSVSCWMLGSERLSDKLCRHLNVKPGEMSQDGEYTVLPIVCLGACDHAPVAMVNGELRPDLTENIVQELLGE